MGHRYFLALNNDKEVIDVHNNHNQNMSKTISDSVMNVSCKLNGMKHKFNYAPSSTLSDVPIFMLMQLEVPVKIQYMRIQATTYHKR